MNINKITEIMFFLVVLLIGTITSHTDIKYGKIKNKHLVVFAIFGALVYIISSVLSIINGNKINIRYFIDVFINVIIAFVVSFGLWKKKVWAGGDAKLFILYAFVVPLSIYENDYLLFFPSFSLLVNIFVIASIYYIIRFILKPDKKAVVKSLKELLNYKMIFSSLLYFFGFYWVFYAIGIKNILVIYGLIFVVSGIMGWLEKKAEIVNKTEIYILIGLAILRLLIDKNVYSAAYLIHFAVYFAVYILIKGFLYNLIEYGYEKSIKLKDLKKEHIIVGVEEQEQKEKANEKRLQSKINKRLSKRSIEMLKRLWPDKTVKVSSAARFAVFMFLGAILTFMIKRNVVYFVVELIKIHL